MYELMILGQLARYPMHGYRIAKVIGSIMCPFRQVQWGALYPILKRLQEDGLICEEEGTDGTTERSRKVYTITEAGRRRLHELLMDTEHHLGEYNTVFPFKVSLFSLLRPEERLHLARHYVVHAQQNVDHLERKRQDVMAVERLPEEHRVNILRVIEHAITRWQAEQSWAEELIAQQRVEEAV